MIRKIRHFNLTDWKSRSNRKARTAQMWILTLEHSLLRLHTMRQATRIRKKIPVNLRLMEKTGNQLTFTNVFVLETSITVRDDVGHKDVDWSGGNDSVGYYISNGAVQQIHWSKEPNNEWSRLTFFDENGNELSINRGKSYIAFNYPNQTEMN